MLIAGLSVLRSCEAKVSHHDAHESPRKSTPPPQPSRTKSPEKSAGEEETIEDVDEETIDEIVEKNDRNLVVILCEIDELSCCEANWKFLSFPDDKKSKCPQCEEALSELEV